MAYSRRLIFQTWQGPRNSPKGWSGDENEVYLDYKSLKNVPNNAVLHAVFWGTNKFGSIWATVTSLASALAITAADSCGRQSWWLHGTKQTKLDSGHKKMHATSHLFDGI